MRSLLRFTGDLVEQSGRRLLRALLWHDHEGLLTQLTTAALASFWQNLGAPAAPYPTEAPKEQQDGQHQQDHL